jgi:hypothetical protein
VPALVLALLCVITAAAGGFLYWQRQNPAFVDPTIFASARTGVQALYAYDYKDSDGSVQRKLDVLTGDLRDQYEKVLGQGGIIDTYEQVSADYELRRPRRGVSSRSTTAQDTANRRGVFGEYVVKSVNFGEAGGSRGVGVAP